MPGMMRPMPWLVRDVGSVSSTSRVRTCVRAVCDVSTTGDRPETVTVSWIEPTCSWTLTFAVKSAGRSI